MSRNVRVLQCTSEDVFEVLADGWLYPSWVVGASRMREVDETWPMADAELHHSFGVWPLLINDKTVVEEFVPSRRMVMKARGWPIGEARVTIDVKPRGDRCVVRFQEEAVAGPGRFVPAPLMDIALHWRNDETLHRLAYLAEGTAARRAAATTAEREMAASGETQQLDAAPPGDAVGFGAANPGGDEEGDPAMSPAGAGSEPVVVPIGESESLPPMTPGDDGDSARPAVEEPAQRPAASRPPDVDEQVARADEAGASTGTPEESWNSMSGAGESEPVTPDEHGAPQK
ncbi:SRPBCC family protein [Microbacterium sp. LWH3-1.2]|uniref:SRPBCC family protein n=1 Tax=Microbacterium sp. LWH3-1.2 TaxID=3135256 RepID=UPI0039C8F7AE